MAFFYGRIVLNIVCDGYAWVQSCVYDDSCEPFSNMYRDKKRSCKCNIAFKFMFQSKVLNETFSIMRQTHGDCAWERAHHIIYELRVLV